MDILSNKKVVIVISVAAALFIFELGAFVGYHRAQFSYRGGERYAVMMSGSPIHGAAGRIVSVSMPSFVVVGPDNVEKTVTVNGKTMITRMRGQASTSAIQPDEFTVVLGDPDDAGFINARFIRLMPTQPLPQK